MGVSVCGRALLTGILLSFVTACQMRETRSIQYIALLAPFEGQARDIGYQSLYALRLSVMESSASRVTILAVDDGGDIVYAMDRMRGLGIDERVFAVITAGHTASASAVHRAADGLAVLSAGYWGSEPASDNSFVMASASIRDAVSAPDTVGLEATLPYFVTVMDDPQVLQLVASTRLPDADFRLRYLSVDQFVPEPGLIAVQAYETAKLVLELYDQNPGARLTSDVLQPLFPDGYYRDAPLYTYRFDEDGVLLPVDRVVEER